MRIFSAMYYIAVPNSNFVKRKVLWIIGALVICLAGFAGWKFFGASVSTASGEFFYVKTGATTDSVRNDLLEKKYISGTLWYNLASKILRFKTTKPGRYKITKGMSLFKLIRMLRSGKQAQVNFVITKIRTMGDFARKAGNQFEFDSVQTLQFFKNPDTLRNYGLDTNNVMAVILPYTYSLNWNSTPQKLFQRIHAAYKNFWTFSRRARADSMNLTPVQIITLASIVEEETNKKSDKPLIASVYLNRLAKGMPLQADPTIKYALKNFTLKRITGEELKVLSPFNTYINKGLPPGPICTPSLETVNAVLYAPQTDYLYFVASSRFDGNSIFTNNIADHDRYARAYQQELTRRLDSASKVKPN